MIARPAPTKGVPRVRSAKLVACPRVWFLGPDGERREGRVLHSMGGTWVVFEELTQERWLLETADFHPVL
jgi:hypothetical protein